MSAESPSTVIEAVQFLVMHWRAHLDEIGQRFLLLKCGEERFPGVKTAKIIFWRTGGVPDNRTLEEYRQAGHLLLGIGGGDLDEHPSFFGKRKMGECGTTLVAKALGIRDDPVFKPIIDFILRTDTDAVSQPFDLAHLVKVMHARYPDNPQFVIDWATQALEAKYEEQVKFLKAEDDLVSAQIEKLNDALLMVTVLSDNEQMSNFIRHKHKDAALVIQMRSSGNVHIFTNKKHKVSLEPLVAAIRKAEKEFKGEEVTESDEELMAEGRVRGAEEWFFQEAGQTLLNGSLTAPDVPPTKLPLRLIQTLARSNV